MRPGDLPEKGDLIVLSFDPRAGHEQKGRRPALVISNVTFNGGTGMAIVCPITNTDRGVPFHVPVPRGTDVTGFIMVEQVKAIDFGARRWKSIGRVSQDTVEEVLSILTACL